MANNGLASTDSSLSSFERNSYFYGKLLTVRDFELEQKYGIEKNHLLNRLIQGKGIVCGLEVDEKITLEKDNQQDTVFLRVQISQGVALDSLGQEIVVTQNISEALELNTRGKNYIYIQYKEQPTERVSQVENGYARIKETYTIFASSEVPSTQIKGIVFVESDTDSESILGVKVEAVDAKTQIVKAVTFTDILGNYTLLVSNGNYQVKASANGFKTKISGVITVSLDKQSESIKTIEDLTLIPDSSETPSFLIQELVQNYYNDYLSTYSGYNQDSKILLGVVNISADNAPPTLDKQETAKYRQIVYSNPMLYDLLSKINATIPAPADTVSSIEQTLIPGISPQFAHADHIHNLADDVVTASKINSKIFTSSDNSISIAKTQDKQSFDLKVASSVKLPVPGETATSIQQTSNAGSSTEFARADHIHNLLINDRGPDASGKFIFTPGDNINLVPGQKPNELVISATGDNASTPTAIFTGTQELEFETDEALPKGSLVPVSVTVEDLKEGQPFSVMLAPILPADIPPITRPSLGQKEGLHFVFGSNIQLPRMYVAYVPLPYNKTFEIHGFDANCANNNKEQKVKVVYWVIAGSQEVNAPSASIKDKVLEVIRSSDSEGIKITGLMRELGVARSELEPELAQLVEAGEIQRGSGNRFQISGT
ncbi:carboxypeptidase-like regulatory domain-containing protein (plasmid) [Nostoc sp. UHCC 0926]|uniref:carboxypeptidase-like regulatory domain-containing protein n=1 Tax=Nostoc sp. UHCC 0926 TaxID=3025190 RepID=UPI002362DF87|nr:carboxypeptidase-like regulatory domain-containing protein [Nostoc sp. UHCC 0926]WDD36380.1 carboxypeptidase-like regulatory domain-containing protein [Nostoc sp. UHCC 0926]